MLQSMREKTQGVIAGVIVGLIAITFALWGIQNYLKDSDATRVVAKVNGSTISQAELHVAYERAKRMQMLNLGSAFSLDQKMQAQLKQQVLQQLVKTTVIMAAAKNMGLGIGSYQLNSAIAELPVFQSNGHFSPERLQQMLSNLGYSESEFISEMQHQLLMTQLQMGIVSSDFVLPNELDYAKLLLNQKRDFAYFILDPQRFAQQIKITPEQEQKYYNEHKEDFMSPEKISIAYVVLSADNLQKQIKPTTNQLQKYYQDHIDAFSAPKRWQLAKMLLPLAQNADAKTVAAAQEKLNTIAVKLASGEDFNKLAGSQLSVSWLTREEMLSDFAKEVEKLSVGQVSAPFRTQDGVNLVKVVAITPAKVQNYALVADKVKKNYAHQLLMQMFAEQSDKLADLVFTNSQSLSPAASALGLEINTTGLFTKDGEKTGILADPKILKLAFSESVLKQNYNSTPIELHSGEVVVLRVKEHLPSEVIPFAKVQATITEKLKQQAAMQKVATFAQELRTALEIGKNPQELQSKYNLTWHVVNKTARHVVGIDKNLLKAAFALTPSQTHKPVVTIANLADDNCAIIRLDRVYADAATTPVLEVQLQEMQKELQAGMGEYTFALMINGLMHNAKIKIEDALAKDVATENE